MIQKRPLRMTRQRRIILDELKKVKSHPTADQVYEMVRRRLPKISLATVYRNLDILSGAGVILKIESGGTQRRYDGDTSDHSHIRCVRCNRVGDVFVSPINVPAVDESQACGFTVLGHRVEFYGVCPECAREKKSSRA
ncbi:MAG: transcriptional repressor [Desulfatibacillaceae bacterium]|nr:transcriptional repressor [Desulfatibacillaceae bacterium]